MSLWLVRHAQPLINPGVCYGASDIAADPEATQHTAQALALVLPQGLQLVSSPLQRCERLTHNLCALRPDLTLKIDPRLREMDFGNWEGQRWEAIARSELDGWTAAFATWPCGGAECVDAFMGRVATAWDEARAHLQAQGQATVWITHAGVIRAASLIAQGVRHVTDARQWPQKAPAFGQWWQI